MHSLANLLSPFEFFGGTQGFLRGDSKVLGANAKFLWGTQTFLQMNTKVFIGENVILFFFQSYIFRGSVDHSSDAVQTQARSTVKKSLMRTHISWENTTGLAREQKSFASKRKSFGKYFFLPSHILSTTYVPFIKVY